jgi:putative ABC transport system permease protein
MFSLLRSLTFRYLLQKWDRSVLVALSIALGVATLVSSRLLNQCVDAAAKDTTIPVDIADLYVHNGEQGVDWAIVDELRAAKIPGVRRVERFVSVPARMPELGNRSAVVFGLDTSRRDDADVKTLDDLWHVLDQWRVRLTLVTENTPRFIGQERPPFIVMSRRLYEERKIAGRAITDPVEIRHTDRTTKFYIGAIVDIAKDSPYAPFADNLLAIDAWHAAKLMNRPGAGDGDRINRADVFVEEGADVESIRQRVSAVVGHRASVRTAEENRKSTDEVIGGVKLVLNLCSLGALVVGLFLVYNAMSVTVAERRHDIGVMRSLGATREQIARLFTVEAMILGAIGSLPGIPLGVALAKLAIAEFGQELTSAFLNAGSSFQPELTLTTGILAVAAGMVTALLAALVPSLQAASDEPADAVRRAPSTSARALRWLHRFACVGLVSAGVVTVLLRQHLPSRMGSMMGMTLILTGLFLAMPIVVGLLARLLHPLCRWLFGVEARLAADNLIRSPGRTGVVIGALAAGVALMFQTAGVGKSNEVPIREWLEQVIRGDAFIFRGNMVSANSSMTPMEPQLREKLEKLPGVERVIGLRFYRPEYGGTFILVLAIDALDYQQAIRAREPEGLPALDRMAELPNGNYTIISDNFAAKWKVKEGDTITVPGPRGPIDLKVIGVGRDYSWSQGTIFIDRKKYAELFGDPLVDQYQVFFRPDVNQDEAYEGVRAFAGREDLIVQNRESIHLYLAGVLERIFRIAYLQQIIVAVVAALGVVMALLISVLQRRRELGLLRAVGATQPQVMKSVLAEALLMGLLGTLLGFLMGLPMEWYLLRVVMQEETGFVFDVLIPWKEALGIGAICVATATAAGLLPALHAVRLNIPEAIAYE